MMYWISKDKVRSGKIISDDGEIAKVESNGKIYDVPLSLLHERREWLDRRVIETRSDMRKWKKDKFASLSEARRWILTGGVI